MEICSQSAQPVYYRVYNTTVSYLFLAKDDSHMVCSRPADHCCSLHSPCSGSLALWTLGDWEGQHLAPPRKRSEVDGLYESNERGCDAGYVVCAACCTGTSFSNQLQLEIENTTM